jgi:hypothetical protein
MEAHPEWAISGEQLLENIRQLHVDLLQAGEDESVVELTAEEQADLLEAQAEAARGEIAIAAEVLAVFSKYRV